MNHSQMNMFQKRSHVDSSQSDKNVVSYAKAKYEYEINHLLRRWAHMFSDSELRMYRTQVKTYESERDLLCLHSKLSSFVQRERTTRELSNSMSEMAKNSQRLLDLVVPQSKIYVDSTVSKTYWIEYEAASNTQEQNDVTLKRYRKNHFCMDRGSGCYMVYGKVMHETTLDSLVKRYPQCETCKSLAASTNNYDIQKSIWYYQAQKEAIVEEKQTWRQCSEQLLDFDQVKKRISDHSQNKTIDAFVTGMSLVFDRMIKTTATTTSVNEDHLQEDISNLFKLDINK